MTQHWPRAWPEAAGRAQFKSRVDDFRVVEIPAEVPLGTGEHLYLRVEKSGRATPAVAALLARAFAVPGSAVGYAGMKDKRAVTEQWFSVLTRRDSAPCLEDPGVRVLEVTRHRCKLRRGDLAGNCFRVRLRGVTGERWQERLGCLAAGGVPNYFGPQRFGGDNLERARDWLLNRRRRRVTAFRAGLYLSVMRSFLFNEVLATRVRAGAWDRLLPGDVAGPDTHSPTAPLWGRGRSATGGDARVVEQRALRAHEPLCEALEHAGVGQARRSLVLRARDLTWQAEDDRLSMTFTLPAGGYATTLLAEVFDLAVPECGS